MTYSEIYLATSHDVVQKGVFPGNLRQQTQSCLEMFALGLILNVENKVCLCDSVPDKLSHSRPQSSYNFSSSVSFCCLCTQTQPVGHKSASLVQKHSHIHQVMKSKVLWGSHRRAAGRLLQTLHIGLKNPYQIMRSIVVIIVTFNLKRDENMAWSDLKWMRLEGKTEENLERSCKKSIKWRTIAQVYWSLHSKMSKTPPEQHTKQDMFPKMFPLPTFHKVRYMKKPVVKEYSRSSVFSESSLGTVVFLRKQHDLKYSN